MIAFCRFTKCFVLVTFFNIHWVCYNNKYSYGWTMQCLLVANRSILNARRFKIGHVVTGLPDLKLTTQDQWRRYIKKSIPEINLIPLRQPVYCGWFPVLVICNCNPLRVIVSMIKQI